MSTTTTIPLKTLIEAADDIKALLDLKFRASTGFRVYKATKPAIAEIEVFEKARQDLFQRLGRPDEQNPGALQIPPESLQEFATEINELLDQEVELQLPIMKMEELEEGLLGEISPLQLHRLSKLIY